MFKVIAAVVVASTAVLAQTPNALTPVPPLVREGDTQKISEHVYVIPDHSVQLVPNVGIIVGTRGKLVIDTGLGPRNGQTVYNEAQKINDSGTLWLATTHIHPEHDLGASAFPRDTQMIRSDAEEQEIRQTGLATANLFASRSPIAADLLKGATFRQANITFSDEYILDLGGVRVRMMAMGLNHTAGDTAFLVEPDGVLFSGDIVMMGLPNVATPTVDFHHWIASLDALAKLAPKRIVPSHGPMGDASMIPVYREYFTTILARTQAAKAAGKSQEDAAAAVAAELAGKYDRNRVLQAARVAYNNPE
ncbi:MAG TPA: MBL fold metallo-hydrolase [Vicinamibacterales bacterium]|nr:MBL fold metallo-hydrolase [Vicinamibacterales bacterium]